MFLHYTTPFCPPRRQRLRFEAELRRVLDSLYYDMTLYTMKYNDIKHDLSLYQRSLRRIHARHVVLIRSSSRRVSCANVPAGRFYPEAAGAIAGLVAG